MYLRVLILIAAALFIVNLQMTSAQQSSPRCGTDELHQALLNKGIFQQGSVESYVEYVQAEPNKKKSQHNYLIPVVVHIVHQGGIENISDSQVKSQIIALNNDLRRIPGTKGYASGIDMNIEFALASIDPNGMPTTGITRTSSPLSDVYYAAADSTFFAGDSLLKTLVGWPRDRYMNVWIVSQINNDNILGYAYYPPSMGTSIWDGNSVHDGIVIAHWYWGTEGTAWPGLDKGATGTHEVGHWLGLLHPFEITLDTLPDGCACINCLSCADRVCDTPPTKDPNFGYPGRRNSCSNDTPDIPDHTRNYMDYVDDDHMDMFTAGQRTRAQFFMDNDMFRKELSTDSNHINSGTGVYGALTADFHSNVTSSCVGGAISFTEYSMNVPTQTNWTFPGGNPMSSTSFNPVVTYDMPGTYDVMLTLINNEGDTTSSKSGYIIITDTSYSLPFSEDFEGSTFPPSNWHLENPDSGGIDSRTWFNDLTHGGFGQSQRCASIGMWQYSIYNQRDALILPPVDLTNMQNAMMKFSVAYVPYDSLFWLDTLLISVSADCGSNWTEVYRKGGFDLAKSNMTTAFFFPDSNDWKIDSADLSVAAQSIALVKIESLNKYGNNLYLDDISIEGVPVGMSERGLNEALSIYPNPSSGDITLEFISDKQQSIYIWVYNVLGKKLFTELITINVGLNSIFLNLDNFGSAGVYFVNIITKERSYTSRMIIY